jgi:hypothetical protein
MGFTKHSTKRPFCVYGLVDFREPSSPDGSNSHLMQVGQAVRSEDQFAKVGPSQDLCAAAEVLFDHSSCPQVKPHMRLQSMEPVLIALS